MRTVPPLFLGGGGTVELLSLFVYNFFFTYLEVKKREWLVVIVYEEKETIKRIKKN